MLNPAKKMKYHVFYPVSLMEIIQRILPHTKQTGTRFHSHRGMQGHAGVLPLHLFLNQKYSG